MTARARPHRLLLALLLGLGAAVAVYGYTAASAVPGTRAGDGTGAISGYTVSNVAYTLNAIDPTRIDRVDFTLDAAATSVRVKVESGGSSYTACTVTGGTSVSCDFAGGSEPAVVAADELRVIAVQ